MDLKPSELPADLAGAFDGARERLGAFASTILFYSTIGSTNDVALRAAGGAESAHGTLVLADAQTSGRGRLGRSWFSPPGSGIYASLVLSLRRAQIDSERAVTLLTITAGVALAEAVEATTGLRVDLKWPNDLYVGGRKLGGILAEGVARSADSPRRISMVVVGYGINIRPAAFPEQLAASATSIESELGMAADRASVTVETIAALARRTTDLAAGRFDAILDAWRRRAPAARGARVAWSTSAGSRTGVTAGIDDNGALLIETANGMERIVSGEVLWE